MNVHLFVVALALYGLTASAAETRSQFFHPIQDCRDTGCSDGYYCAPMTSYMYACFKDTSGLSFQTEDVSRRSMTSSEMLNSKTFSTTGKSCNSPWSDTGIFSEADENSYNDANVVCEREGPTLKAVRQSVVRFSDYYEQQSPSIVHCAEAEADYVCDGSDHQRASADAPR